MKPLTPIYVLYTHPESGYDSDVAYGKKYLKPDTYYKVESISMGQSNTNVMLVGVPGSFNSVQLEFFNEDHTPTDIFERSDVNGYLGMFGGSV